MCTHLITASCYFVGLFIRFSGNTDEWSSLFRGLYALGQIIAPAIYVVYNVTQSVYIGFWIQRHMKKTTVLAGRRDQSFQSENWMPRLRRLYWMQILLFIADITAIATAVIANVIANDPWWVLNDVAVSVIYVECLAVGYIFIELRGICLTLNVSNERQALKHVKMKGLGRGVRVAELDTVKIFHAFGKPGQTTASIFYTYLR